jgi:hypothetical protein
MARTEPMAAAGTALRQCVHGRAGVHDVCGPLDREGADRGRPGHSVEHEALTWPVPALALALARRRCRASGFAPRTGADGVPNTAVAPGVGDADQRPEEGQTR